MTIKISKSEAAAITALRDAARIRDDEFEVMICQIAFGHWEPECRNGFRGPKEARSRARAVACCREMLADRRRATCGVQS